MAQVGAQPVSTGTEVIQYPHIPTQTLFPPAEATLVRADIRTAFEKLSATSWARATTCPRPSARWAANVTLLADADLAHGDLSRFDAIVTGVRAFNTRADLRANYQRLFDYVQQRRNAGGAVQRAGGGGGPAIAAAPADGSAARRTSAPIPSASAADRVTDGRSAGHISESAAPPAACAE